MKFFQIIKYFIFLSIFQSVMASANFKENLENTVQDYLSSCFLNAAFMFSDNNEILIHGAKGIFSTDGVQLKSNQIMPITSNTKPIIAAAILRLQDKGFLNVKDKIIKHLDKNSDLWKLIDKVPDFANNITIHHLLTHSSGIADYTQQKNLIDPTTMTHQIINQEIIKFAVNNKLEFTPGSKYKYSNTNFILLALIIEKISNKTLKEFLKEEFFDPLEMNSTYVVNNKEDSEIKNKIDEIYPVRYLVTPNNTTRPTFVAIDEDSVFMPYAGGIISTTSDIIKLYKALFHGNVLSKSSYDLMIKKYFTVNGQLGGKTSIGYGIYISEDKNKNVIYHSYGKDLGIRSEFGYIPKLNLYFAILSNVSQLSFEDKNIDLNLPINQLEILYFLKYILANVGL